MSQQKTIKFSILEWLTGLIFSAGIFGLYLSILPDRLTWANNGADGGDFLSAILTGGIPHPTGYPTYLLLGGLFQALPFSTPYFRGALLSAITASLSLFFSYLWVLTILKAKSFGKASIAGGIIAGLSLAISPLFWSQAVIVESYCLHSLFIVLSIWWVTILLLKMWSVSERIYLLVLAGLAGLGMGNHITLILFTPAWVYGLVMAKREGMSWKLIGSQAVLFGAGVCVYLTLPLRAQHYPPVNWGNPQSLEGLAWLVSGRLYQSSFFRGSFSQLLQRIWEWLNFFIRQFNQVGIVLGLIGFVFLWIHNKAVTILLSWAFVAYSVFSILYRVYDANNYSLPAFISFSAGIGFGTAYLSRFKVRTFPVGWALVGCYLILLGVRMPVIRSDVDARKDLLAAAYAETYLKIAPPNALLITTEDADTFPLWYYHFGLKYRPDVRVIVISLTRFRWYQETLTHTYADLNYPPFSENNGDAWGQELIEDNSQRPICRTHIDNQSLYGIRIECPGKSG